MARRLAQDGHTVRVMSRTLDRVRKMFVDDEEHDNSLSFEAVQGDVEDAESLRKAMTGCTGVHLNLASVNGDWDLERRGAQVASKVASETKGMKRITIITGASTCEEYAWFPGTKAKLGAENALKDSGVPYTIFRCTMFMETLPNWVQGGQKAFIVGDQPNPWHWIAAKDYASMAYSSEKAANKTFYVYGPEKLTMEEALNIYIPTCAPNAKITHVPFWVMWLIGWIRGSNGVILRKVVIPLFQYFQKVQELGDESDIAEANSVLGFPTTTVQAWCDEYHTVQHQ